MPKNISDTPHNTPTLSNAASSQPPKSTGRIPATGKVTRKKLTEKAIRLFGRRIHGPLDRRAGGLRRRRYMKIAPTNINVDASSRA